MFDSENVDNFSGGDFGEKASFTIGASYTVGAALGLLRGIYYGRPKQPNMPWKLKLNNTFNAVGREFSSFANGFAAAGLMYYLMGVGLNFVLEDELKDLPHYQRNMICGAMTGGLFKSTKGVIGAATGATLGAAIMFGLTKLTEYGNEKGYVAFEMKY